MRSIRQQQIQEELRKMAGNFISNESNRQSLITPTRVEVSPDLKRATVYFTVFPEDKEDDVLNFLRRKRSEFKTYLKKLKFKILPFVDFEIDRGEKNRQALEDIEV